MQLSEHLETNLTALNARLGSSADFYAKRIELYRCRGAILLFDGMASLESLWELLLDAASRQTPPLLSGQAAPGGERVKETLRRARPQMLLDSSYFVPWLFPCRVRTASPVGYTERPAVAAAKLCEGKILILVNGSPSAMILPTLFCENFECLDDYAQPAFFASFLRVLKYGAFYLSIFLPGAFVCLAVYLPELMPPQLLFKIEAAERATPLPLFAEMVVVILLLEVIREAGLRMPQTLGHSVSLVAAIIIGDAAIATGLMSTPVILIAAVASIAVFVVPSLYEAATIFRLLVLLAAGIAGPVGFVTAALAVLLALTRVSALGVPYCAPLPFPKAGISQDGVTRRNYRTLSARPFTIWQKRRKAP